MGNIYVYVIMSLSYLTFKAVGDPAHIDEDVQEAQQQCVTFPRTKVLYLRKST